MTNKRKEIHWFLSVKNLLLIFLFQIFYLSFSGCFSFVHSRWFSVLVSSVPFFHITLYYSKKLFEIFRWNIIDYSVWSFSKPYFLLTNRKENIMESYTLRFYWKLSCFPICFFICRVLCICLSKFVKTSRSHPHLSTWLKHRVISDVHIVLPYCFLVWLMCFQWIFLLSILRDVSEAGYTAMPVFFFSLNF